MQPQAGASNHAQRAFAANEKLVEIVSRIVLGQATQRSQDRAVGKHGLQPQHLGAVHAVAQHANAASIGGDVAADRRRAARADIDAEHQAGRIGRFLHHLQRRAGFRDDGCRGAVGRFDRGHALQRQHRFARLHARAAGQPGAAAMDDQLLADTTA